MSSSIAERVASGTNVYVPTPLIGCFLSAEDPAFLGPNRKWNSINTDQERFLTTAFEPGRNLAQYMRPGELDSVASWECKIVNAFLKKHGFKIQLEEFDDDTFGVASVMKVMDRWIKEGKSTQIDCQDGEMREGFEVTAGYEVLLARSHPNPIACITTQNGDRVHFTVAEKKATGFDLLDKITKISSEGEKVGSMFDALQAPMIDLDLESDVSWLLDMWTNSAAGQKARITQALLQTKLKINETGFLCESAASMAVTLEACYDGPSNPLIIDEPCLFWIERPGLPRTLPIIAAYLDYDVWNSPGEIEGL